jgi:hypothetical protein
MPFTARAIRVAVVMFLLLLPTVCRADVAPEYPQTAWGRDRVPSRITIIAVGAAISAAIVTLGLFLSRQPVHNSAARKVTIGLLGVALLGVIGYAIRASRQADRDRGLWKQWDEEVENRRRNWRGPPQYENPPQPVTSETTP